MLSVSPSKFSSVQGGTYLYAQGSLMYLTLSLTTDYQNDSVLGWSMCEPFYFFSSSYTGEVWRLGQSLMTVFINHNFGKEKQAEVESNLGLVYIPASGASAFTTSQTCSCTQCQS